MSLFRYPGSKVWWYDFRFAGEQFRKSTKTRNKNLAREAERARRQELVLGFNRIPTSQKAKKFEAALEDYLRVKKLTWEPTTYTTESINGKKLVARFGSKLVTDFHPEEIKQYQNDRLAAGAKPKTINLELSTLRAVLKRNRAWANIQPDVRQLPAGDDVGRALDFEEENRLIAACARSNSPVIYAIVVLALCTGMRKKELLKMCWTQVDLHARVITVGRTKTRHGSYRRIPINERAYRMLNEWAAKFPDRQGSHYLFPSSHQAPKQRWILDPQRPCSFSSYTWSKVQKGAGIKCRFHDLRHTVCTRMLENNIPFPVVAAIMGWSAGTTIEMTKRYGHIGQKSFEAAVAVLNGAHCDPNHGPDNKKPVSRGQQLDLFTSNSVCSTGDHATAEKRTA